MSYLFNRLFKMRYDKMRNLRQYLWSAQGITARRRNTYLMEQMENRYLLSADAAPLALSAELLNEELIVEQLIDAGLAEASNSDALQLVRQHDYELKTSDSLEANADLNNLQPIDLESSPEDATEDNGEELTSVLPKEGTSEETLDEENVSAEGGEQSAETVATIKHIQQLSGHQFVVIDRSVEDYSALLSTFMGDAGGDLEWQSETTSAGNVLIADWYPVDDNADSTSVVETQSVDELIDTSIKRTQADRVTVVLLDAQADGVEQLAEVLSVYEDVAALHVLSHGAAGLLRLGTASLGSSSLERYRQQLEAWGKALKADGDILIYGCNLAQGEVGIDFVDRLAGVTEADIAASDDLTGNAFIGGDWILETYTGAIESDYFVEAFAINDPIYSGVLAAHKLIH